MARPLIEDFHHLDAHALWRAHATQADRRCDPGYQARLDMDWKDADGRRRTNYFEIELAPCRYGGLRAYFFCPAEMCGRRCTRLYGAAGRWLCRQCHGLAYRSQRLHKARRLIYRRHKLLKRIGGVEDDGWVKPRPKGMWERTYLDLQVEADTLEDRAFRHFAVEHGLGGS